MTFGEYIKAQRERIHMSQKDMAYLLEISPQYLSDLEHNKRAPTQEFLNLFLFYVDISADVLYFLAGRIPPSLRDMGLSISEIRIGCTEFRNAVEWAREESV